jgi:DNA polymerase-3 subunit delta'
MARAKTIVSDAIETAPEADRLGEWPHPRETVGLFGHQSAEQSLLNAYNSGQLHHGWLIIGEEGVGKAALAYRFARFLLSRGVSGGRAESLETDPSSLAFRQTASLSHPGLFVLRRTWRTKEQKHTQNIAVDEIRRLRHFLRMTAASAWRVVIVDSADDLNAASANALLKSLEEPPVRTVFLIVCSAPGRLPPTIMSRCRRMHLRPLVEGPFQDALRATLAHAGREPPAGAELTQLTQLADGSPRRALELISGGGLRMYGALMEIFAALPEADYRAVHRLVSGVQGKGAEQDRDMLFSLIGATLTRLIKSAALGSGPAALPAAFGAARLITPATLGLWAELWEKIAHMQAEAERLNLDKPALILGVFGEIEKTARRCAG